MRKQKEYTPTVCDRKLHRLTLITEKNIGKVQGDINRFLSKPTMILRGFKNEIIGTEYQECGGDVYPVHKYGDPVPNYVPFIGKCSMHYLWKKHLEGDDIYTSRRGTDEIPRLAISSAFEQGCCPISIGSRYKIYGKKLVILDPFNKFLHTNPYSKPSWLRYHEYIQVDSLTDSQIFDTKATGLSCSICDGICYADEELKYRITGQYNRDIVYDAIRTASDLIDKAIPHILKDDIFDTHTETFDVNGKTLTLIVDVKKWLSGVEDSWYLLDGDNKTRNLVDAMCSLYHAEIDKWNSYPSSDGDDFDLDDWY